MAKKKNNDTEYRPSVNESFGIGTINNFNNQTLSHADFNQDHTCFIYTFNNEFCVWDCETLKVRYTKVFKKNLGRTTVLYKTNIVVLSSSPEVHDPLINVMSAFIWDDHNNRFIAELNFTDLVVNVKVLRKHIIIVLKNGIYIYELNNLTVLESFDTRANPEGLCAVSDNSETDQAIIAFPGKEMGSVHIYRTHTETTSLMPPGKVEGTENLYSSQNGTTLIIKAHQSELGAIALSRDGSKIATGSNKGTVVRCFDATTGEPEFEFRRGSTPAKINNLSFNESATLLCATSFKDHGIGGTVHIYRLSSDNQNKYYLKSLGFSGLDYSDARIYLKQVTSPYLCGFDRDTDDIIVISYDGVCYKYVDGDKTPIVNNLTKVASETQKPKTLNYSLSETVRLIPKIE